jgi:AAA family ATP:ADP antiporter
MTAGYAAYALMPTFAVAVAVMIVRRVGEYAVTRPCRDTLYTIVTREEKYKAKSLIDTFVYRGGDATSGSLHKALTSTLGLSSAAIGWVGAAISALWLVLALGLGRAHGDKRDSFRS